MGRCRGSGRFRRKRPTSALPLAERLDVGRGAVAEPAVELRLFLELLAAQARDDEELAC